MSSEIERVIRRDLDQLPLLPPERWVPARRRGSGGGIMLALRASMVVAIAIAALIVGSGLARMRTAVTEQAAAHPPTSAVTASAPTAPIGRISRQAALDRVRGLSLVNPTITRIEAKLVRRDVLQAAGPNIVAPNMPGDTAWVVALSGEVRCSFCIMPPTTPFHSGLYLLDARTGDVFSTSASADFWPKGFDALPDDALAARSETALGHVVEIHLPDLLIVRTDVPAGPGTVVMLRADADSSFSWAAGIVGGSAFSLGELVGNGQLAPGGTVVRITYGPRLRPDGTYRLESLLTGALSR